MPGPRIRLAVLQAWGEGLDDAVGYLLGVCLWVKTRSGQVGAGDGVEYPRVQLVGYIERGFIAIFAQGLLAGVAADGPVVVVEGDGGDGDGGVGEGAEEVVLFGKFD